MMTTPTNIPTPAQVAALKEAAEKATPRPWSLGPPHVIWQRYRETETNARIHRPIASCDAAAGNNPENAQYIALAANHAEGLVALAKKAMKVVKAAKLFRANANDRILECAREEWGNTNVSCAKDTGAELDKALDAFRADPCTEWLKESE